MPPTDAILNPATALQSVVEDYLESLSQTAGPSLAELINCVLRACGCSHTLDSDEAVDYDGVVDALDNITEALKQVRAIVYPVLPWRLISSLRTIPPYTL